MPDDCLKSMKLEIALNVGYFLTVYLSIIYVYHLYTFYIYLTIFSCIILYYILYYYIYYYIHVYIYILFIYIYHLYIWSHSEKNEQTRVKILQIFVDECAQSGFYKWTYTTI